MSATALATAGHRDAATAGRRYVGWLAAGLSVAVATCDVAAHRRGLPPAAVFVALMAIVPCGVLGTRLLYWLADRRRLRRQGRPFRDGGAMLVGGLPGLLAASALVLPLVGLPFGAFWDVAVYGLFAGLAVSRFACLTRGCCCGRETAGRFALRLPDTAGRVRRRIPTQLVEAAAGAALLGALVAWQRPLDAWAPFDGALFVAGVAAYSALRLALDPLRQPDGTAAIRRLQTAAYLALLTVTCCALALAL
ncbi:MAG TPA: prolipoprotein diacylglyceryl transferase family protein [Thermoanaerobaculia bacterium]|nr:prolipoprotein diacylglyceryl transferase family protein [Thermoanaerobaculia bacterium]